MTEDIEICLWKKKRGSEILCDELHNLKLADFLQASLRLDSCWNPNVGRNLLHLAVRMSSTTLEFVDATRSRIFRWWSSVLALYLLSEVNLEILESACKLLNNTESDYSLYSIWVSLWEWLECLNMVLRTDIYKLTTICTSLSFSLTTPHLLHQSFYSIPWIYYVARWQGGSKFFKF